MEMLLADVVAASAASAATSRRSEKADVLARLLARCAPDELPPVIGWLLAAPRQGRLGVGWATLAEVEPGGATPELTVGEVDLVFNDLAAASGAGSQARRHDLIAGLFARATSAEAGFLRGAILGEVRQGALAGVLTDAVGRAFAVNSTLLRRAVMMCGGIAAATVIARHGGDGALAEVKLEPGRGVEPMLASSASSVTEAMSTVAPAGEPSSIEWKLDGARIQVHRVGDDVKIFTRNLNEISHRLPHVVEIVRSMAADPLVLDGEILGLDADGQPRIFQETMSRFSSDTVGSASGLLPFFFDVLHADGDDLTAMPLVQRRGILERIADRRCVPALTTSDASAAALFAAEALRLGHEGVMVKAAASTYEAGRRGKQWCKVKPVRTLDLVVLAAEWGHGRRNGWLSNLHLGARAVDGDGFVMVGKTFKGLTDELLTWQTAALLEREISRDRWSVKVRPELVVEIALDGVQISSRYPGGVALRFARVRGYRPDRNVDSTDTIDDVRRLLPGTT